MINKCFDSELELFSYGIHYIADDIENDISGDLSESENGDDMPGYDELLYHYKVKKMIREDIEDEEINGDMPTFEQLVEHYKVT